MSKEEAEKLTMQVWPTLRVPKEMFDGVEEISKKINRNVGFRAITQTLVASSAIKWFCDSVETYGTDLSLPSCATRFAVPEVDMKQIDLIDTFVLPFKLLEGHFQTLQRVTEDNDRDSVSEVMRIAIGNYTASFTARHDCAVGVAYDVQYVNPPINFLYGKNVHLNCQ